MTKLIPHPSSCECHQCAEIVLTEEGARKLAEILTRPPRDIPKLRELFRKKG